MSDQDRDEYGLLHFPCVSCGEDATDECSYGRDYGVCSICAEAIANHFSFAHSGRWATWTHLNPPPVKQRPKVSGDTRFAVFRRDGFVCQLCGTTDGEMTVDHIKPISKGGDDSIENLRTACRRCNCARGNRE